MNSLSAPALEEGNGTKLVDELRASESQMPELKAGMHGEARAGAGNERAWAEDDDGCVVGFNRLFKSVPGAVWDFPELGEWEGEQVNDDAGQVAIAEDEIGGLDGLLRSLAADPEQLRAFVWREGCGIEGVPTIDQGEFRD